MTHKTRMTPAATTKVERAMELADELMDCLDIYMQEIASEDSISVRTMARSILAQRLGDGE